jgi:hypothetical protein
VALSRGCPKNRRCVTGILLQFVCDSRRILWVLKSALTKQGSYKKTVLLVEDSCKQENESLKTENAIIVGRALQIAH